MSESSLKRWSDKGLLPIERTAGGHRRVSVAGVVQFARKHGHTIERPAALGLVAAPARASRDLGVIAQELAAHLLAGEPVLVRRVLTGLYLQGVSLARLFDEVLAPAFARLGEGWAHGNVDIYEEHRASAIAHEVLSELKLICKTPALRAPLAIGAALSGDHYTLALASAELVLRDAGMKTENLGANLPGESLAKAIERLAPRVCFVSASALEDATASRHALEIVARACSAHDVTLIVGGRCARELVASSTAATVLDCLGDLEALA